MTSATPLKPKTIGQELETSLNSRQAIEAGARAAYETFTGCWTPWKPTAWHQLPEWSRAVWRRVVMVALRAMRGAGR